MNNYTLYYPTIEFQDKNWLWSALLIWDRIYRIVPSNYTPMDPVEVKEIIYNSNVISDINPEEYNSEASKEFIKGLKVNGKWWAAALDNLNYKKQEYIELHKDKADVKLRKLILGEGLPQNDWLRVPGDIASIYMLYLANNIAKRNNLSLSTDLSEAWCGSNFFQYDGNINDFDLENNITTLAGITISSFIPTNIESLSVKKLLDFREKSSQERQRFFQNMRNLSTKISSCEDATVIGDIIADNLKELRESKREYIKRMFDIKATALMGLKTVMVPALISVISAFQKIPDNVVQQLQAVGVGIGAVAGVWDQHINISKERKNFECNYLMQLQECVPFWWKDCKNKDWRNIHEGYQMYLNDNFNHFLRD